MNPGILTSGYQPPPLPYGLLGRPTQVPMPGNYLHPETQDWASLPPGTARLVTALASGVFSAEVRSTTGYVAVRWWDGSVEVFGNGVPPQGTGFGKPIPSSGNWSGSVPKEIFIWSCTAGNATRSGDLTTMSVGGANLLTSLNVSGCTALTTLFCAANLLTSLNVSGCTALGTLACNNNPLTSLRAVGVAPSGYGYASNYLVYPGPAYFNISAVNCNLSAAALNQLYADLGAVTYTATIGVAGNPGTTADDPTIATAKGWIVYGS